MDKRMRFISILAFMFLAFSGCNIANVAQGPTEVMLLFTYPVDQVPDQVSLELKDAEGEVLADIKVPQMPKTFSPEGQESVGLKLSAEWAERGRLTFVAQALREDLVILTGDASFNLEAGTVTDVILNLALPEEESADGGVTEPSVDSGVVVEPVDDGGVVPIDLLKKA